MSELDGFEVMPYIDQRTNKGKIASRDKRIEQLEDEIGGTRTISIPSLALNYVDNRLESIGMGGELYVRQRALESYGQVPERGKRNDGGERESYRKRTRDSIDDLMARKDGRKSRYTALFGTPEKTARTLLYVLNCKDSRPWISCGSCPILDGCKVRGDGHDALLGWLRGENE